MDCPKEAQTEHPNCKHRLGKTSYINPDGTETVIVEKEMCELTECNPEETT